MSCNNFVEVWKPVPGFSNYSVSNLGSVRRESSRMLLRLSLGKKNYPKVNLRQDGASKCWRIHSLVALVFLPPRPSKRHQVAHWDGDALNCCVDNLRWATQSENELDKIRHGRVQRNWKLRPEYIPKIREYIAEGISLQFIGNLYGVTDKAIRDIKAGRKWKWA